MQITYLISNFDSLESAPFKSTALGSCLVCLGLNSSLPVMTPYLQCRRLGGSRAGLGGSANLAPTGIRSPDRPSSSESLYWLSYPFHLPFTKVTVIYCAALPSFHVSFNTAQPYRRSVTGYSPSKPSFDSRSVCLGFMVDWVEFGSGFFRNLRLSAVSIFPVMLCNCTARCRCSTSSCGLHSWMNVVKFALLQSLQTDAGFQQPSVLWAPCLLSLVVWQSGNAVDFWPSAAAMYEQ